MYEWILDVVRPSYDDDAVDRLHYLVGSWLTFVLATATAAYHYGGNPIQCWVPKEYPEAWQKYISRYCFLENAYWLSINGDYRSLQYYPWIPFILALQGSLLCLPRILWVVLSLHHDAAGATAKRAGRKRAARAVAVHIIESGYTQPRGLFLCFTYIGIKLLFLGNAVGQFFLLENYFQPNFGNNILWSKNVSYITESSFPKVALCTLSTRSIGDTATEMMDQQITLQCVLWANLLNEKIFIGLWWWYVVSAFLTAINIVGWLLFLLPKGRREQFVARQLRARQLLDSNSDHPPPLVQRFVRRLIKPDGILTLRFLADGPGHLCAVDVTEALWRHWLVNEG